MSFPFRSDSDRVGFIFTDFRRLEDGKRADLGIRRRNFAMLRADDGGHAAVTNGLASKFCPVFIYYTSNSELRSKSYGFIPIPASQQLARAGGRRGPCAGCAARSEKVARAGP